MPIVKQGRIGRSAPPAVRVATLRVLAWGWRVLLVCTIATGVTAWMLGPTSPPGLRNDVRWLLIWVCVICGPASGVLNVWSTIVTARSAEFVSRRRGLVCRRCGFDLSGQGDLEGVCPECGAPYNGYALAAWWRVMLKDDRIGSEPDGSDG
jgi:hypothetical protein